MSLMDSSFIPLSLISFAVVLSSSGTRHSHFPTRTFIKKTDSNLSCKTAIIDSAATVDQHTITLVIFVRSRWTETVGKVMSSTYLMFLLFFRSNASFASARSLCCHRWHYYRPSLLQLIQLQDPPFQHEEALLRST
jgi:hypothetical protein